MSMPIALSAEKESLRECSMTFEVLPHDISTYINRRMIIMSDFLIHQCQDLSPCISISF